MKTEIKTFEFKVDDADNKSGMIRGFASTFGNIDLGDDVVDVGAFKKTIKESGGKFPILADHNPTTPLGWNIRAEETEKGLYVEGKYNMEDPFARARYALAQQALEIGAKMGLSIGYAVIKAESDKERPSLRRLKELKLYEYSQVVFPMNTAAMVTAAKAWHEITTQQELVERIKLEAKSRGIGLHDLSKALLEGGAAEIEIDPVDFDQSMERIFNLLKGSA